MTLYYCLANTDVNGETVIQGSSVTYSASASAFDNSSKSFEDAAKVATINSNKAAISAARETVDKILVQYSYVLADENITSMISNSLKTVITPIRLITLESISYTNDGINYFGNKNVQFAADEVLLIPTGKFLIVSKQFKYTGTGRIQIGSDSDKNSSAGFTKEFADIGVNNITISVLTNGFLNIIADPSTRGSYTNTSRINNKGRTTIKNSTFGVSSTGSVANYRGASFSVTK